MLFLYGNIKSGVFMKKCSVKLDSNVQKEMNKNLWVTSLISFVLSFLGVISYLVVDYLYSASWVNIYLCVVFIAFVLGFAFFLVVNNMNRKTLNDNFVLDVEIYESYFVSTTRDKDQVLASINLKYDNVVKIKETKKFLFLYLSRTMAVPICKNQFSKEEISMIKVWVNAPKLNNIGLYN